MKNTSPRAGTEIDLPGTNTNSPPAKPEVPAQNPQPAQPQPGDPVPMQ